MARPFVALSGAWMPVSVLQYLARGFEPWADVLRVGTWPREGSWLPWGPEGHLGEGYTVAAPYRTQRPHVLVDENGDVTVTPGDPTWERARSDGVDAWFDVDGGWAWTAGLPVQCAYRGLVVTDPHCEGWRAAEHADLRGRVDVVWQMQSGPWLRDGDLVLNYAYDAGWHRSVPVATSHDVTILGQPYAEREHLAARLRDAGLRVLGPGVVGVGEEYAAALCRAPVAVVWPLAADLPARYFEALACGRAVVVRRVEDLQRVLPAESDRVGVNVVDDLDHAVENVVLCHGTLALEAAIDPAALALQVAGHSWADRARSLLL